MTNTAINLGRSFGEASQGFLSMPVQNLGSAFAAANSDDPSAPTIGLDNINSPYI